MIAEAKALWILRRVRGFWRDGMEVPLLEMDVTGGRSMSKTLLLGAALTVLALTVPASAELKFKPGEDPRFHWQNYDDLKKVDLKGQTLTVFGPWRGEDEALVRSVLDYFTEATGVDLKYSSSENYEQQIVI